MMINLCFPVLTNYSGLAAAINSACKGSLRPTQINIIDNGGKFKENFGDIKEVEGIPLNIFVPKLNWGVGRSFNNFLHRFDDYIIISNDDVIFHERTIELLVKAAEDNPNELLICPNAYWQHYFSLFLIRKNALSIVGEFDSNIFCYHEDRDYKYRLKLAGYEPFIVKDCTYEHVDGGSQTIRSGEKIATDACSSFNDIGRYYQLKWGGIAENENFIKPFNLL